MEARTPSEELLPALAPDGQSVPVLAMLLAIGVLFFFLHVWFYKLLLDVKER